MRWPTRAETGAFLETLALPLVLLACGVSSLGCLGWRFALVLLLPAIFVGSVGSPIMGFAVVIWSLFAVPLGLWNMGRYLRWFAGEEGRGRGLALVLGNSLLLAATNPFFIASYFRL